MPVKLKSKEEIAIMREGGKILATVVDAVMKKIKAGVSTMELNEFAEQMIKDHGAKPSFKNYKTAWASTPFPSALCISINEEVVHGIPKADRIIKSGDVIGIDCGLEYKGLYTDMAKTKIVDRNKDKRAAQMVSITEEALTKGIKRIKPGRRLNEISKAIQDHIESHGFAVVRQLVGHGVGFAAHEEPQVPNYEDPQFGKLILKSGMTLAIEPMVTMGDWPVETLKDGWTIVTEDGSLSAHFEHTIAVTDRGYEILTKL